MGKYTENLRTRIDIVGGKKHGHCVICRTLGPLTADHVPPKGCIQITEIVLKSLVPVEGEGRGHLLQDGVKFRTICKKCNNDRLGLQHDPHLKDLVDQIRSQMISTPNTAYLPRIFQAKFNAHHVARAIIGHILAAHSVKEVTAASARGGANESLHDYFLAPDHKFPAEWRLYCWPHFYREQIIQRHFAIADMGLSNVDDGFTYGHILKFLPLGFWLVHQQRPQVQIPAYEITPTSTNHNEEMHFMFDARARYSRDFPIEPIGNNVILLNNEQGSIAQAKATRKT